MPDHWAVTVWRNGEEVVTIESSCLSGREISEADEKAIRIAALHLLGFVGQEIAVADFLAERNLPMFNEMKSEALTEALTSMQADSLPGRTVFELTVENLTDAIDEYAAHIQAKLRGQNAPR